MKILVAIVAYNEEQNIEGVIRDLKENNFGFDIVLIDNGSTDRTVQIAERLDVDVVSHCINSGGSSGTLRSYFSYAYKNSYDLLCQYDGDGQMFATELPKLVDPIIHKKADLVIGTRFIDKKGFQSTFLRRIGIKLFSLIDSFVIGYKFTDITNGYRAYSRTVIEFFGKKFKHEIHDASQLVLLSHFAGARFLEVPVVARERLHGKSEFNFFSSVGFIIKGFINIIGVILQKGEYRSQIERLKQMG